MRETAAASIVLLKNDRNVLAFNKEKTVSRHGAKNDRCRLDRDNAKVAAYCGGGSASLEPYDAITSFEGIAAQANHVTYNVGC